MQFIQEFEILDEKLQVEIVDLMKADEQPFGDSEIYNSVQEEKQYAPEKRISMFKRIIEKGLFDKFDKLVDIINQRNESIEFSVVKNDITYIKYAEGGFFDIHEDYLSMTSNFVQEYTMIMCIDAECVGGETELHLNPNFSYKSKSTTTPLHCLIFRKDIKHQGVLIQSGYKEIATVNLYATSNVINDRTIVVSTNDDKIFCIPYDWIMNSKSPHNILRVAVDFMDRQNGGNEKKIIQYKEDNYDSDEFQIIYDLYQGKYISPEEIDHPIIDYYGFQMDQILVDQFKEKAIATVVLQEDEMDTKSELLLFGDHAKYNKVKQDVVDNLVELIPFRIIFIEGTMTYGGEMEGTPEQQITMQPIYIDFADHVYYIENVVSKGDIGNFSKEKYKKIRTYYGGAVTKTDFITACFGLQVPFQDLTDFEEYRRKYQEKNMATFLNIPENKMIKVNPDYRKALEKTKKETLKVGDDTYFLYCSRSGVVKLYCLFGAPQKNILDVLTAGDRKLDDEEENNFHYTTKIPLKSKEELPAEIPQNATYYIDGENNIRLPLETIYQINQYMDNNQDQWIEGIKDRINDIKYNFPQIKTSFDEHFCNENVYGGVNLLELNGFFKLPKN